MTALNKASLFNTSVFRLALVIVAIFAITAVALVRYVFPATNDMLTAQVLQTIDAEATGLREQYASGGLTQLTTVLRARSRTTNASLYYLEDASGQKLAGNLSRLPPEILSSTEGGVFGYSSAKRPAPVRDTNTATAQRLAAGVVISVPGGARLVVARDIEEQREFARKVKWALYGGFGLLLLIGLGGGLLVSRVTLRRIGVVTQTSRDIMAGDLSRRIPLSGSNDELDRLSGNLNAMLERIEQLMIGLREVSDNIAHDLKTPLNRLRNRAEAALRDPNGEAAYRDGLEATIEEADDLIKTFNALLSIARLDAGAAVDDMELIDLDAVVRDVGELYGPLAEEQGFAFSVTTADDMTITGNRQLIGQALANLIDNAIKYTAPISDDFLPKQFEAESCVTQASEASNPGSAEKDTKIPITINAIDLSVERAGHQMLLGQTPNGGGQTLDGGRRTPEGGMAQIVVADNGPGIPAALRQQALKRFARLDESRTRPGSGLGLSLVSAVVRLHGGTMRLEDNQPGLRVVIELPIALASKARNANIKTADAAI